MYEATGEPVQVRLAWAKASTIIQGLADSIKDETLRATLSGWAADLTGAAARMGQNVAGSARTHQAELTVRGLVAGVISLAAVRPGLVRTGKRSSCKVAEKRRAGGCLRSDVARPLRSRSAEQPRYQCADCYWPPLRSTGASLFGFARAR